VIASPGALFLPTKRRGRSILNSSETPIYSKSRVLFNSTNAKEAIRKLEYSILVEGDGLHFSVRRRVSQCDCQLRHFVHRTPGKICGPFSKNVIVNFDPDTAGARATERTLGLLVGEESTIRVLTLETGFDPDLFIRRKVKTLMAQRSETRRSTSTI